MEQMYESIHSIKLSIVMIYPQYQSVHTVNLSNGDQGFYSPGLGSDGTVTNLLGNFDFFADIRGNITGVSRGDV